MTLFTETGDLLLDETGLPLITEPASWAPGDTWPGTPGGAGRDGWSPYIRLYLTAAIGAGTPWTVGPDPAARLDAGNIVSKPGMVAGDTLDIDLTDKLTALHIQAGASTQSGIFTKPDAAVLEAEIYDPDTALDPLNPYSPFGLNGAQRLTPGIPISCWTEIVDPADATVTTIFLFTGTADRWSEKWVTDPHDRRAILQATDPTKLFTKANHPAQTPLGTGDYVSTRIARIVTEYGWTGTITGPTVHPLGTIPGGLTATDMSGSAWDQLQALMDLEIGFLHFTRTGQLRWLDRSVWTTDAAFARIILGDHNVNPLAHDIVTDATPLAIDQNLHNSVYASTDGGTVHHVEATASVADWGEQSLTRTDLAMVYDPDVSAWAATVLTLEGYPQTTLERIDVQPALSHAPWEAWVGILGGGLITAIIRTVWTPPDTPNTIPVDSRIVGFSTDISPWDWSVRLELVSANMSTNAPVFTVGPAARDQLDSGYVVGF